MIVGKRVIHQHLIAPKSRTLGSPNYYTRLYRNRQPSFRQRHRIYTSCKPGEPIISSPKRSALDPLPALLSITIAFGVGYLTTQYLTAPSSSPDTKETLDQPIVTAPSAHLYPHTMAASMPPGRPGALTADQEAKLKEMWLEVLEIFGVSHEEHDKSTTADTTSSTASTDSPDSKKKKKSKLSVFRRSSKSSADATNGNDASDNDKHGQTKEFQQALASMSPEDIREAFWSMSKHDHPDALLLRFLRARKWDVHSAIIMAISTLHWRIKDVKVDEDIMRNGEEAAAKQTMPTDKKEAEDFLTQLRMGKSFLHGTDLQGRPICYVRVRLHKPGQQSEASLERFTVYEIETTRMMLRPPVDTAVRSNHFSVDLEKTQLTVRF